MSVKRPGSCRWLVHVRRGGALTGLAAALALAAGAASANSQGLEEREAELRSLRARIQETADDLEKASAEYRHLDRLLSESERSADRLLDRLRDVQARMEERRAQTRQLREQSRILEDGVRTERQQIAQQVRALYREGRGGLLKLLLNQEDLSTTNRLFMYYKRVNGERIDYVRHIASRARDIRKLQERAREELERSEALERKYIDSMNRYLASRKARKRMLAELDLMIGAKSEDLDALRRGERELAALIERLKTLPPGADGEFPPFARLRGILPWPVAGEIRATFGADRKGRILRWQGVDFQTAPDAPVRAISRGRVVFADGVQGLGQLIILDHGGDYMSLYGNNRLLSRSAGDRVEAGEVIGWTAGGQERPGLYFEIRHRGIPIDPALWCREKTTEKA